MRGGSARSLTGCGSTREQHVAIERHVFDRAREDAERVEGARRFHDAVRAQVAPRRTIAERSAERRRPRGRSGGLRADRKRHHGSCDGGGRSAGRASGGAFRVPRIARLAGMNVRELGRDRLAHEHAAGLARKSDACRIAPRPMAFEDRRAVLGRHVRGVDDVLHAIGHADERPALVAAVEFPCLFDRGIRIEVLPRLHLRFAFDDAIEARTRDRLARRVACANRRDDLGGGEGVKRRWRVRHHFVTFVGPSFDPDTRRLDHLRPRLELFLHVTPRILRACCRRDARQPRQSACSVRVRPRSLPVPG